MQSGEFSNLHQRSMGPLLSYLGKEMTTLATLSASCVAAVAFLILTSDLSIMRELPSASHWCIAIACVCLLLAACCFFAQRTGLAAWYGRIAIIIATESPQTADYDLLLIVQELDRWQAWRAYSSGRYLLGIALLQLLTATGGMLPAYMRRALFPFVAPYLPALLLLLLVVAFVAARKRYLKSKYEEMEL